MSSYRYTFTRDKNGNLRADLEGETEGRDEQSTVESPPSQETADELRQNKNEARRC